MKTHFWVSLVKTGQELHDTSLIFIRTLLNGSKLISDLSKSTNNVTVRSGVEIFNVFLQIHFTVWKLSDFVWRGKEEEELKCIDTWRAKRHQCRYWDRNEKTEHHFNFWYLVIGANHSTILCACLFVRKLISSLFSTQRSSHCYSSLFQHT